jgi:hypothetical protein
MIWMPCLNWLSAADIGVQKFENSRSYTVPVSGLVMLTALLYRNRWRLIDVLCNVAELG